MNKQLSLFESTVENKFDNLNRLHSPGQESNYSLRNYQVDLIQRVFDSLSTHRATMMQLPTGGGKTVCFSKKGRRQRAGGRRNTALYLLLRPKGARV